MQFRIVEMEGTYLKFMITGDIAEIVADTSNHGLPIGQVVMLHQSVVGGWKVKIEGKFPDRTSNTQMAVDWWYVADKDLKPIF